MSALLYDVRLLTPEPCAHCGTMMPTDRQIVVRIDGVKLCNRTCAAAKVENETAPRATVAA